MNLALNAIGQTYRSFRVTQYLPLPELQSALVELVHEPTGARVMQIANSDPENLFSLSFQTLPSSSNGVAHILEHTVLCGSEKFPVKDPFFSMTRRSLNTYMNALTGQDFTCYPASSQVVKDFYNLLEVYLDAVFHPELKQLSFLQEGHRLAFAEPDNPASALTFQGIVYNEMKGARASADSRLIHALYKQLMPDLTYSYDSGGDPKEIPNLTWEELKEFHRIFYHPSRCLFFFYGNIPLSKHLDFLLEELFEKKQWEKLSPPLPIPLQKRFSSPVHHTASYPIAHGESTTQKTMIAIGWLTAPISEQTDLLALCLIDSILMDTDASPLKRALLKSGLCAQADASLDLEMSEVPFAIICKGCRPDSGEKIQQCIQKELEKIASKPIDRKKIDAALHQIEFDRSEIGSSGAPFGLILFFRSALLKQHGVEPENGLLIHSLFKDLRARLEEEMFLPNILRKYLIDNNHSALITFLPDPDLQAKEEAEEKERLETIRKKLKPCEIEAIIQQTKELAAFQESHEKQSLDCLPKISLADIPRKSIDFPIDQESIGQMQLFHTDSFTNQILYADFFFDLPHLEAEDLSLLSLYGHLFNEVGCGGRNYEENLEYLESYTGEAGASLSLNTEFPHSDRCRPTFSIRIKALRRYGKQLCELLGDYAQGVDLSDEERLIEWLQQHATELEHRLVKNGLNYAVQTGLSALSIPSFIYNEWHGLPYYQMVQRGKHETSWIERLRKLQDKLFYSSPHLVLSCTREEKEELVKERFYGLADRLKKGNHTSWRGDYPLPSPRSGAHFIASPVAFTAQTLRTCSHSHPDAAALLIAGDLIDNVVLHKEIREKGGAYGSGAVYSPAIGNTYLYSYRDPHVSKTLRAFEKGLETIGRGQFGEKDLEEAKLGVIQTLDQPVSPGNRASVAYAWKRSGRTLPIRQTFREMLLDATKEQVARAVQTRWTEKPWNTISFLGKELYEKEKLSLPLL